MDENIQKALNEVILDELYSLKNLSEADRKEYATRVGLLAKLYELKIAEFKCERETYEKHKDRWFKLGTDAAGIILPLIFYAVWMRRGFKFEETGTYTSMTFKNLFNRLKPTGKQ